jgi:F0F1-type ATP synthase delta subunit
MKLKMKMNVPKEEVTIDVEMEYSVEEMAQGMKNFKEICNAIKEGYIFIKEELKNDEIKTVIEKIQEIIPTRTTTETTVYPSDSGTTEVTETEIRPTFDLHDIMAKAKASFNKA